MFINPGVQPVSLYDLGAASFTTELLRKAFEEASKLPPGEQDALASVLLLEIEGEYQWDATLAGTRDVLAGLADAALAEHRAGETQPLDPDRL